jgi:hypothetical protein
MMVHWLSSPWIMDLQIFPTARVVGWCFPCVFLMLPWRGCVRPVLRLQAYVDCRGDRSKWWHRWLTNVVLRRASRLLVTSTGSTLGLGFDSLWERISQDLMAFVLSVVGDVPVDSETSVVTSTISQDLTAFVLSVVRDVPVDSEAPVVTSSILRICRHNLQRCS